MADRETIRFVLPSGEAINADIPAGMSDSEAKVYMMSKRPDLFIPQMQQENEGFADTLKRIVANMPRPQPEIQTAGAGTDTTTVPNPKTAIAKGGEDASGKTGNAIAKVTLGGTAALGAGAAGNAALQTAVPVLTAGVRAIVPWARANPVAAYAAYQALHTILGGTLKLIQGAPVSGPPTTHPPE